VQPLIHGGVTIIYVVFDSAELACRVENCAPLDFTFVEQISNA
jgi:hypothetical protein